MGVRYLSITIEVEVACPPEMTVEQAGTVVTDLSDHVKMWSRHDIVTVDTHDWDLSKVFDR